MSSQTDKYIEAFKVWLVGRPGSDGEWRAYDPAHEDPQQSKSPSASFNFQTGVWHCQSCGRGGSIKVLYKAMQIKGVQHPKPAHVEAGNGPSKQQGKPLPDKDQLRRWHKRMMEHRAVHQFLNETRGLHDETLRKFRIGFDGQRIVIPIYDEDGNLANIRRYKRNAIDKNKMISWSKGQGEARLFGHEMLRRYDTIVLAEGELDRILAVQEGLPAVTHTGGAAVFKAEWAKWFKDKNVYVAYDDDAKGDQGAMKVASILKDVASSVWRLKLDTGIKGGDITDFFVTNGLGVDDFNERLEAAQPLFKPEHVGVIPTKGRRVSLSESQNTAYGSEPLELVGMVSGKRTPAYVAPKTLKGTCDQGAGAVCAICPLAVGDGERTISLRSDDPRLLRYIDTSDWKQQNLNRELLGAKCKNHVVIEQIGEQNIEEIILAPRVDDSNEPASQQITRTVYNITTYNTPVNQAVRIVGRQEPDPRNSRGVFHGWLAEPVNVDIDNFKMTPELREELLVFRNDIGQSPLEKCIEIAEDLSANVTRIYGRDIMHVAYDLVWHSIMSFNLNGATVDKGWLEALILGDTRTGKSEVSKALIHHYRAGITESCESVSLAGLVGGVQQPGDGKSWIVTWGSLPLNDRRLVVLDEMTGLYDHRSKASKGIIEAMSSIRSDGIAQITKIKAAETTARTRLVWISNPLRAQRLSEIAGSALNALQDLVRSPEDIARFDFVMAASNNEVESSVINSSQHNKVAHAYTADLCHELVMWAWSRRPEHVRWAAGAEECVLQAAERLGREYAPDPPLIQAENVRVKIARIAVAMAARTFSTNATGEVVIVKRQHVLSALEFLDIVYSNKAMGYKQHSLAQAADRELAEQARGEARTYLTNNPHLIDVFQAVGQTAFRPRDFEDIGGIDKAEVQTIMPKFLAWKMIRRGAQGWLRMTPSLVELIAELEDG